MYSLDNINNECMISLLMKIVSSWSIDFIFGFCEKYDKQARWHFKWQEDLMILQNPQTNDNDKARGDKQLETWRGVHKLRWFNKLWVEFLLEKNL